MGSPETEAHHSAPEDAPQSAPRKPLIPRKLLIIGGLVIASLIAIYFLGMDVVHDLAATLEKQRTPEMLFWTSLLYTILLALPGVPGLEIGMVMILIFRFEGAVAMYISAVLGLNLAFIFGRMVPTEKLKRLFRKKASGAVDGGEGGMEEALKKTKIGRFFMKLLGKGENTGRYVMIFLLFNMPGNFVFGGGGGIGMLCGTNRNFRWIPYMITVLIAAAPIPLLALAGLIQATE